MITLFTDLDNTMIYSKRRLESTANMTCVEYYNNEPLSYMLNSTISGLAELSKRINIVPITTRVDYQYDRIGLQDFEYVLINNGGVLLHNGVVDKSWFEESYDLSLAAGEEFYKIETALMGKVALLRMPDNMFIFAKSENIDYIYDYVMSMADLSKVHVFKQGKKLYVMPYGMNKGNAIKRFKERFNCEDVYSAGDEILDFSMADESIKFITSNTSCRKKNCIKSESAIFSDEIIDYIKGLV